MIDIIGQLNAIRREVGEGRVPAGAARTVRLRRSYDAPIEDVWDAITSPERINRWFQPVTGDFRLGGMYQIKDNAGGEIVRCEPPRLLKVTWIFGEAPADSSEVEVRLSAGDGDETVLELEHTAVVDPQWWTEYGPGAVGVGWDLTLLSLSLHLLGGDVEDHEAWQATPEARQFMTRSSEAWGEALRATGASDSEVATATGNTTAAYVPPAPV